MALNLRSNVEPGHAIRIVIADDDPQIRRALRRAFEDGRFDVVGEASDGAEAMAETARRMPDVLIIDLAMPNTNGMEAIAEIREASPETKIIVFSSWVPFYEMGTKAIAEGATVCIDKFTSPRKLVKAVVRVAQGA